MMKGGRSPRRGRLVAERPGQGGIRLEGETRKITDGPFTETKELIGGYWMLQAKSIDEVVELDEALPLDKNGGELKIRRLIDVGDFALSEKRTRCTSASKKPTGKRGRPSRRRRERQRCG